MWDNLSVHNKLKAIEPNIEPWQSRNREVRVEEVILTRMHIGHTRITHNFLFTKTPQPSCRCGDTLSAQRLLSCPNHQRLRSSLPTAPTLLDNPEENDSLIQYQKNKHVLRSPRSTTSSPRTPSPLLQLF